MERVRVEDCFTNRKEWVEDLIKKEGIYRILKNPPLQVTDNETINLEKEQICEDVALNYLVEKEEIEIYTLKEIIEHYEELVEEWIGKEAWEKLGFYIDIEAMIRDDIYSGYLAWEVGESGNIYFWFVP